MNLFFFVFDRMRTMRTTEMMTMRMTEMMKPTTARPFRLPVVPVPVADWKEKEGVIVALVLVVA